MALVILFLTSIAVGQKRVEQCPEISEPFTCTMLLKPPSYKLDMAFSEEGSSLSKQLDECNEYVNRFVRRGEEEDVYCTAFNNEVRLAMDNEDDCEDFVMRLDKLIDKEYKPSVIKLPNSNNNYVTKKGFECRKAGPHFYIDTRERPYVLEEDCSFHADVLNELFKYSLEINVLKTRAIPSNALSSEFTDPSDKETLIVGEVYRFAPLSIDNATANLTCGSVSDLHYSLDAPGAEDWYVQPLSGVVMGTFRETGQFRFTIHAVDKAGETFKIESYVVTVTKSPEFKLVTLPGRQLMEDVTSTALIDPTNKSHVYYKDTNYMFAPRDFDREKSSFSAGNAADVTYRVLWAPSTFFLNSGTGILYGSFPVEKSYTMKIIVLDKNGKEQDLETLTFVVVPRPTFVLRTRKGASRVMSRDATYTDPSDSSSEFYVGETYLFPRLKLDRTKTIPSSGTINDITFGLRGHPPGFFVDTLSGEIFGEFVEPGSFNWTLFAQDKAGQQADMEVYSFEVLERPIFDFVSLDTRIDSDEIEFTDPLDKDTKFIVGRTYSFAPLEMDEERTTVSFGSTDDIVFRLENAPETFFINSETGVMYGEFLKTGEHNFSLIAVDKGGEEDVVEVFDFTIVEPPRINITFKTPIERVYRRNVNYTDPKQSEPLHLGKNYLFAPLSLDFNTTRVSDGDVDQIRYWLQGAPDGFFVNPDTGEISGTFLKVGNYSMKLFGQDKGRQDGLVEQIDITAVEAPTFGIHPDFNKEQLTNNLPPVCAVGQSYTVDGPKLPINEVVINAVDYDSVFYMVYCEDANKSKVDCPGTFFVDPKTGDSLVLPSEEATDLVMVLGTMDLGGGSATVKSWLFSAKYRDTENAANGPNGQGCFGGVMVDEDEFDGRFTCDCRNSSNYEGPNCEEKVRVAEASDSSSQESTIVGASLGVIILLAILAFVTVRYYAYVVSRRPVDFEAKFQEMLESGEFDAVQISQHNLPKEIRRRNVTLIDQIGSGAFGEVWKGLVDESAQGGPPEYLVAVKTVLDSKATPEARDELLSEAGVMAQIKPHPNLVSLVGVVTRGEPLMVLISFCEHGSLLGFLKSRAETNERLTEVERLTIAIQIAKGMAHLVEHNFIHRDLAARNVLLATGMICKVADFGLSRGAKNTEGSEDYYRSQSGVFPVRWTAPEAMETLRFSTATDVWSFGIVVIEIFQHGETPYPGKSNPEVINLTMSGQRHDRPLDCSLDIYNVLLKCWDVKASRRPSFKEIVDMLTKISPEALRDSSKVNKVRTSMIPGRSGGSTSLDSIQKSTASAGSMYEYSDGSLPFPDVEKMKNSNPMYEYSSSISVEKDDEENGGYLDVGERESEVNPNPYHTEGQIKKMSLVEEVEEEEDSFGFPP
eukprot:m.244994 g.244994  ORF g.244994 m.244994 type:complete len:1378 (+) comp16106_c0_seq31:355-4488(+)